MEGPVSDFGQNLVRSGKTVSDCHAFKSGKESFVGLLFFDDFFADSWSVFSCVALSENEQGGRCRDVKISSVEATVHSIVELVKSVIKVISDI